MLVHVQSWTRTRPYFADSLRVSVHFSWQLQSLPHIGNWSIAVSFFACLVHQLLCRRQTVELQKLVLQASNPLFQLVVWTPRHRNWLLRMSLATQLIIGTDVAERSEAGNSRVRLLVRCFLPVVDLRSILPCSTRGSTTRVYVFPLGRQLGEGVGDVQSLKHGVQQRVKNAEVDSSELRCAESEINHAWQADSRLRHDAGRSPAVPTTISKVAGSLRYSFWCNPLSNPVNQSFQRLTYTFYNQLPTSLVLHAAKFCLRRYSNERAPACCYKLRIRNCPFRL